MLKSLNRELDWDSSDSEESNQYATCFFALFNPANGLLSYSCAGHVRPFVYVKEKDQLEILKGGGFPLGMFSEGNFNNDEVVLNPGDKVVMYTDGAVDTVDKSGKRFSTKRLKSFGIVTTR